MRRVTVIAERPVGRLGGGNSGARNAVGVGLLAFVSMMTVAMWASPAVAATPISTIDQPATDGAKLAANPVAVSGHVAMDGGILNSIDVTVASTAESHACHLAGNGTSTQTFDCTQALASNGRYTATVQASGEDRPADDTGMHSSTVTRTFLLSAPPASPSGLTAQTDPAARTVKLAWSRNSEPDLTAYVVERRGPGSSAFVTLATVTTATTSYTDSSASTAPAGDYQYVVVARRKAGDGINELDSSPSAPATGTVSGPPAAGTSGPGAGGASGAGPGAGPAGANVNASPRAPGAPLGAAPPLPAPTPADGADLSALLAQAQARATTTTLPDPGYKARLPFTAKSSTQLLTLPDGPQLASGPRLSGLGMGRLTWEYVAGALVLFMLAFHAFYLRRQVERPLPLETLSVSPPSGTEMTDELPPLPTGPR